MLKIKSNTNVFTIIFSEKIGKKKNAQKISFSLCSVQPPSSFLLLFFFLVSTLFYFSPFFFLFSFSAFFFLFSVPHFSPTPPFLFSNVLPFFNPNVGPKTFFSSTQHLSFFLFCSVFSAPFSFQFSASFCCFCLEPLSLVFSASLLLFSRHVALLRSAFYFSFNTCLFVQFLANFQGQKYSL